MKNANSKNLIWTLTIAAVLIINIYPLFWLLWGSVTGPDGFTLKFYSELFHKADFGRMFKNTWIYALGSTFMALAIGVPMAIAVTRTNMPFKKFIRLGSTIAFVSPPWLNAMAYIFLFSPNSGLVNVFTERYLGFKAFNIYSMTGMVLVTGLFLYSYVFITVSGYLESIDSSYEEASVVSGASKLSTILRITVPLARPSIVTATLFSLIMSWGMFATPAILGIPVKIYVFATEIYMLLNSFPPKIELSAVVAVIFSALAILIWYLSNKFSRSEEIGKYVTIGGKGGRKMEIDLGPYRVLLAAAGIFLIISALILPYLVVFLMSLSKTSFFDLSWQNFTLANYHYVLFELSNLWLYLQNTLVLALAVSLGVLFIGMVVSFIRVRTRAKYRHHLETVAMYTIIVPASAFVIGIIWAWINPPLVLYGTLWLIFLGQMSRSLPLGVRNCSDGFQQIDIALEEAASTCGSTWRKNMVNITLPLMKYVLLGTFVLTFLSSARDLLTPLFLTAGSAKTMTLSVAIYYLWGETRIGESTALSIMLILLTLAVYFPLQKILERSATK